jgi:hypothetical protein
MRPLSPEEIASAEALARQRKNAALVTYGVAGGIGAAVAGPVGIAIGLGAAYLLRNATSWVFGGGG